jgi:hypothetical protein
MALALSNPVVRKEAALGLNGHAVWPRSVLSRLLSNAGIATVRPCQSSQNMLITEPR